MRAGPLLTFRDTPGESGRGLDDLLVMLEGDVSADQVEEQDAEGPDAERDGVVGPGLDPLRRTIDSCTYGVGRSLLHNHSHSLSPSQADQLTFELAVSRLFERRSRPKVDDLHLQCPRVHHDVLVFNVSVHNTVHVDELQRLHDLSEEPAGGGGAKTERQCGSNAATRRRTEDPPEREAFRERSSLRDEVKQVLALRRPLHHQQEAPPLHLKPVQHPNDAAVTSDL